MLINETEQLVIIPIDKIIKAPWNYKEDDEEKMKVLMKSLDAYGQVENVIVRELENDERYEVCNGNHRLEAMQRLGYKEIICENRGLISVGEAMLLTIETNETKFEDDTLKMSGLFKEMDLKDMISGYKKEELEKIQKYDEKVDTGFKGREDDIRVFKFKVAEGLMDRVKELIKKKDILTHLRVEIEKEYNARMEGYGK